MDLCTPHHHHKSCALQIAAAMQAMQPPLQQDAIKFDGPKTTSSSTKARARVGDARVLSARSRGLPATPWMRYSHIANLADMYYRVNEGHNNNNIGVTLYGMSASVQHAPYVVPGGLPFLRRMAIGVALVLSRTNAVRIDSNVCINAPATQLPPGESEISVVESDNAVDVIIMPRLAAFDNSLEYVTSHNSRLQYLENTVKYRWRSEDKEAMVGDDDDEDPGIARRSDITMNAVDMVMRQSIEHVFRVHKAIKLSDWAVTPDTQVVLDAWNEVLQFCGASVQFYFTTVEEEEEMSSKDIISGQDDLVVTWNQRYHAHSSLPDRNFRACDVRKYRAGWYMLTQLTHSKRNSVTIVRKKMKLRKSRTQQSMLPLPRIHRRHEDSSCYSGSSSSESSSSSNGSSSSSSEEDEQPPPPSPPAWSLPPPHRGGSSKEEECLTTDEDLTSDEENGVKQPPISATRDSSVDSSSSDDDGMPPNNSQPPPCKRGGSDDLQQPTKKKRMKVENISFTVDSESPMFNHMAYKYTPDDECDCKYVNRIMTEPSVAASSSADSDSSDTTRKIEISYSSTLPQVEDATAAAADVLTASRQWHAKSSAAGGGATSGIELRVTPISDAETVGCRDARRMRALTALYVFLHLHGHHVRKLNILPSSREGSRKKDEVMSGIFLQALRMCTQVRVVESCNDIIADACMASMGSTVNICEVNVHGNDGGVRVRGPDVAAAQVPVVNGSFSRDHSLSTSGLTLSWQHRIINSSILRMNEDNNVGELDMQALYEEEPTEEDDTAARYAAHIDPTKRMRYELNVQRISPYAPHLTTMILNAPTTCRQINEFLHAVRICSATLQHVELTDDYEDIGYWNTLASYCKAYVASMGLRMNCANIMRVMNIKGMKGLRVFRLVGVRTVVKEDIWYFIDNVNEEAPLQHFAVVQSRYSKRDGPSLSQECVDAYVDLTLKFAATLEKLELDFVPDSASRPLVEAIGAVRLQHGHKLVVEYFSKKDHCMYSNLKVMEKEEMEHLNGELLSATDRLERFLLARRSVALSAEKERRTAEVEDAERRVAEARAKYKTLENAFLLFLSCNDPGRVRQGCSVLHYNAQWLLLNTDTTWINTISLNMHGQNAVDIFCEYFGGSGGGSGGSYTTNKLPFVKCLYVYVIGMNYNVVMRGQSNRWVSGYPNAVYDLRTGRCNGPLAIPTSSSIQLFDTITGCPVFGKLNELYVGFSLHTSCVNKFAKWVSEHRHLYSLYVAESAAVTEELCKQMVTSFSFEEKNHSLVEFCTVPIWSKEGNAIRRCVRRNAAELMRSAAHVVRHRRRGCDSSSSGDGWSAVSFQVYKTHGALPTLVSELTGMTPYQAERAIASMPKMSAEMFEEGIKALAMEESGGSNGGNNSDDAPNWIHMFKTSNQAWNVFVDSVDLKETLIKGLKRDRRCTECAPVVAVVAVEQPTAEQPSTSSSYPPDWARGPEGVPQAYIGQKLSRDTIDALKREMEYAYYSSKQYTRTTEINARMAAKDGLDGFMADCSSNGTGSNGTGSAAALDAFQKYVLADPRSPKIDRFLYRGNNKRRCRNWEAACGCIQCKTHHMMLHAGITVISLAK